MPKRNQIPSVNKGKDKNAEKKVNASSEFTEYSEREWCFF